MGNTTSESQLTGHADSYKKLTVDVLQNENAKDQVDVIVCFVDTIWSTDDILSQAMTSLAGNIYVTARDKLKDQHPVCSIGDIFSCSGGKLNCKTVLLVVVPPGDLSQHLLMIPSILQNVIIKVSELDARSIAIPLGIEPPFQVNILLPALYMIYLNQSMESSLVQFHLITTNSELQSQILQTIKEMDHEMNPSDDDLSETPALTENAASNSKTHSHPQLSKDCNPEQHVNLLPPQPTDPQLHTVHENVLGQPVVTENGTNAGQHSSEGGSCFGNTEDVSVDHYDISHTFHQSEVLEQNSETETVESMNSVSNNRSLYTYMVEEMHKQVEKVSENDFLMSVNLRTYENAIPRLVTFSDEVEEYVDPKQPPVVRSLSSDDLGNLDFQNLCVKRPVTRRQGKRPVQRGEPVVVVNHDEELSAVKADPTFFCVICQSEHEINVQRKLDKCKHVFCTACIEDYFVREKPVCPICNTVYGDVRGNMPPGIMSYYTCNESLPGHKRAGVIVIEYDIPEGTQTEEHPHPGKPFKGTSRTAFLPNTEQGQKCLRLLQKAFDQRLTFTVGQSRTTGKKDCVTWNDIHHKTNVQGGPQRFGYPDPGYLDRLERELRDRGITED